ncbi:MAG: hypothetical protein AB7T06_38570 [Kofleriaceae bacterium]
MGWMQTDAGHDDVSVGWMRTDPDDVSVGWMRTDPGDVSGGSMRTRHDDVRTLVRTRHPAHPDDARGTTPLDVRAHLGSHHGVRPDAGHDDGSGGWMRTDLDDVSVGWMRTDPDDVSGGWMRTRHDDVSGGWMRTRHDDVRTFVRTRHPAHPGDGAGDTTSLDVRAHLGSHHGVRPDAGHDDVSGGWMRTELDDVSGGWMRTRHDDVRTFVRTRHPSQSGHRAWRRDSVEVRAHLEARPDACQDIVMTSRDRRHL